MSRRACSKRSGSRFFLNCSASVSRQTPSASVRFARWSRSSRSGIFPLIGPRCFLTIRLPLQPIAESARDVHPSTYGAPRSGVDPANWLSQTPAIYAVEYEPPHGITFAVWRSLLHWHRWRAIKSSRLARVLANLTLFLRWLANRRHRFLIVLIEQPSPILFPAGSKKLLV